MITTDIQRVTQAIWKLQEEQKAALRKVIQSEYKFVVNNIYIVLMI